jgi:hypothetical protein
MSNTKKYVPSENEPSYLRHFSESDAKLLQGLARLHDLKKNNLIVISDDKVQIGLSPFQLPPNIELVSDEE